VIVFSNEGKSMRLINLQRITTLFFFVCGPILGGRICAKRRWKSCYPICPVSFRRRAWTSEINAGKSVGLNRYITNWITDEQVRAYISMLKKKV
jgi:hypothetical protein